MMLNDKKIILALTGGIACYKSAELVRKLRKAGATVDIVMTESAQKFITPLTMQALSGQPVYTDLWDTRFDDAMGHISLTRTADAIVVAPATANFCAKLANGIADDLLSTLCLAREANCPMMLAPAMNKHMWDNVATQRNIKNLKDAGIQILGPDSGEQACGEMGEGRMLEPEIILEAIEALFEPKVLLGKRVLLTAGPTFESIDPVRGITNRSSGKMGFALARAAYQAGADVTLIAGPVSLTTPYGVTRIDVETAAQMHKAVMHQISTEPSFIDIFISVAAVSDWYVSTIAQQKIKKQNQSTALTLNFEMTPDILFDVAHLNAAPYCVGFAAETQMLEEFSEKKRCAKGIPLLIGNIAQHAFEKDDNEVALFDEQGVTYLPRMNKQSLAHRIIYEIAQRL